MAKVRNWNGSELGGSCFFVAFLLLVLIWADWVGSLTLGRISSFHIGLVAIPLLSCWLIGLAFVLAKVARVWHFICLAGMTLTAWPVYTQSWNPDAIFVKKISGLQNGMTISQVEAIMHDFDQGEVGYAPEEFWPSSAGDRQVTHLVYYHSRNSNEALMARVYFSGQEVVGKDLGDY